MQFFATCAKALEPLLARELAALDASEIAEARAGAAFSGTLATAYRVCMWSRVANRVLLPIASFDAPDERALYEGARAIAWSEHLAVDGTLAVDFAVAERAAAAGTAAITHTQFGALRVKDAIVDRFRDESGRRPSVNTRAPDLRVNVYLRDNRATVAIDLSGDSLHRRGWRAEAHKAPLKETLAAALLYLADWPAAAAASAPLVDPMCGSGTLPIEAALMAADAAPGLERRRFGFRRWRGHDAAAWRAIEKEARARRRPIASKIYGSDENARAVALARDNAARAGVADAIEFSVAKLAAAQAPSGSGVVVMNPPYGERLGDAVALVPLYEQIGDVLRHRFTGWRAFVLTSSPDLQKRIGLRPAKKHVVYNGALECRLLELPIADAAPRVPMSSAEWRPRAKVRAEAFANRLRKNLAHLKKWAKREDVTCFRVYDADLLEYAVAVDLYENAAHVAEYAPPSTIEPARAEEHLADAVALVPEVLGLSAADVFVKQRRRQRPETQYGRAGRAERRTIREGGHRFIVNLSEYLDTGLYLDQRRVRALLAELSAGKSFLNLFCYTGTASVYAAAGAARSVSVDWSNTYLEWAGENFALNRVRKDKHALIKSDVQQFLDAERRRFDVIFCAPPTFSNRKGAERDFDVQRDHAALLQACARLLAPGGTLVFINHFRKFKMDVAALAHLGIDNITKQTLPPDFARDPRFHNCWRITTR